MLTKVLNVFNQRANTTTLPTNNYKSLYKRTHYLGSEEDPYPEGILYKKLESKLDILI